MQREIEVGDEEDENGGEGDEDEEDEDEDKQRRGMIKKSDSRWVILISIDWLVGTRCLDQTFGPSRQLGGLLD